MEVMEVRDLKMEYRTVKKEEGIRGSIRHLIKPRYGKKEAVKGVSFSIAQGESVAFLGANGAGKSTTIKMLTGILKPSGGEVSIMGKNPFCDRMENAKKIGVVFGQKTQLWWDIPVIETFRLLKISMRYRMTGTKKYAGIPSDSGFGRISGAAGQEAVAGAAGAGGYGGGTSA